MTEYNPIVFLRFYSQINLKYYGKNYKYTLCF